MGADLRIQCVLWARFSPRTRQRCQRKSARIPFRVRTAAVILIDCVCVQIRAICLFEWTHFGCRLRVAGAACILTQPPISRKRSAHARRFVDPLHRDRLQFAAPPRTSSASLAPRVPFGASGRAGRGSRPAPPAAASRSAQRMQPHADRAESSHGCLLIFSFAERGERENHFSFSGLAARAHTVSSASSAPRVSLSSLGAFRLFLF